MNLRKNRIRLAFLVFAIASLACGLPISSNNQSPTAIPVSIDKAKSLETQLNQALTQAAQTGVLSFEVTEEQLTSAMSLYLQEEQSSVDLPLKNIQVRLRDGKIYLSASTQQGFFKLPVELVAGIEAVSCKIKFNIESASAGPIPIPKEQLNTLVPQAEQALYEQITSSVGGNVCISSIIIQDGKLSVSGQKTP